MTKFNKKNNNVYLIAEIGSNHNQEKNLALEMIDMAADSGADAVKFQSIRFDKLYKREYETENFRRWFKQIELDESWYPDLSKQAKKAGVENSFDIPGFVPEYIRPLFCEGKGPFRWVALSGDKEDIYKTDELALEMFSGDKALCDWIKMANEKVEFQGLPSRICWLGYNDRVKFGLALNEMVKKNELSAPIVIGRDHLDCGSVASPNRETESMKDGSDAVADWPILNALVNTASGATWVSLHHGGGVGMGYSIHAGQVIVADGTDEMYERISKVLTNDPGIGVVRHADAGYDDAIENASKWSIDIPQ